MQSLGGFNSQSQRADCSVAAIPSHRRIRGHGHLSPRPYRYDSDPTSGGWRTSDFIHGTSCTIYRDGTPYAGWAAAAAVADANHEVVVSNPNDWFLIVDEAPSLTYVDRLTVQNWCWTGNGTNGIINVNSGDCVG